MSAGHQQPDALGKRTVLVHVGGEMTAQVVDRVERHIPRCRVGLSRGDADQQCSREARPDGGGDGIRTVDVGCGQRPAHRRSECLKMCARRDLRDDAAEAGVFVDAGSHLVGEQRHVLIQAQLGDADSGFVARTLDREDNHDASRLIVYASAPLTR